MINCLDAHSAAAFFPLYVECRFSPGFVFSDVYSSFMEERLPTCSTHTVRVVLTCSTTQFFSAFPLGTHSHKHRHDSCDAMRREKEKRLTVKEALYWMSKQKGGAYARRKWLFNQWKSAGLILNEKKSNEFIVCCNLILVRDIPLSPLFRKHIKRLFSNLFRCLYEKSL